MIPSEAITLIVKFEEFGAEAYPDPIHGWSVPTIGYGTTIYPDGRKVGVRDRITREEAAKYLDHHLNSKILPALHKIPSYERMFHMQVAALISFAYNLGENFYGGKNFASITRLCDRPDLWWNRDWVISQFIKYRAGAELGLGRRRYAEALTFCWEDPLYAYAEAYRKLNSVEDIRALMPEEEALKLRRSW
ncbi:putative endolysin [Synechococcus phage S-CBWM1]|uniref:Lysozyme n=1 Tax=Synechococcus phage S-CBWM1 TaxID=2053653 RepID=A0A3G1L3E6_9CAUD|nr:endolysin [Synechococcus phage S-CBWM1]ATW62714.1 putative endolysin [Synechococcus phage S-CBWM1]